MITLTEEQAQQIEEIVEHLLIDHPTARHHRACVEALSIIRAARAQEQAEQEPVAWQEVVSNVANNLGEMAAQAHTQRFCDGINAEVDKLFALLPHQLNT